MNATDLAIAMIEWGVKKAELDALGETIETEVLALEKTQTVGTVRATYSKGQSKVDYETPARTHATLADIAKHSTTKTTTTWKALCESLGVEGIKISQGKPSVTLKVME